MEGKMAEVKCKLIAEVGAFPGKTDELEKIINDWLKEEKISDNNFLGSALSDIFLPSHGRTRTIAIFYSKE